VPTTFVGKNNFMAIYYYAHKIIYGVGHRVFAFFWVVNTEKFESAVTHPVCVSIDLSDEQKKEWKFLVQKK